MKKNKWKKITPYLFIAPWIIGFLVFTLGPLIFSLIISMFDWPVVGEHTFVGLGNYIEMFTQDKQVGKSLLISIRYAAIFVPLNICIALYPGGYFRRCDIRYLELGIKWRLRCIKLFTFFDWD